MTAQEFAEWKAWYQIEQQHPQAERFRHAQLLASSMNGPVTRASKEVFVASEFVPADPWAPPKLAEPPPTPAEVAAQVAAINERFNQHG